MKIIDLFNKVVNGEDVPKVIKYNNTFYEFDKELNDYTCSGYRLFGNELEESYKLIEHLNDEVEILDEDKKIEKVLKERKIDGIVRDEIFYITEYNLEDLGNKINELIDKLNKEGK